MCGICGIHSISPPGDLVAIVARMNNALQHRGPDDSGQFSTSLCSIAMRRLSIIDLATGQQPIFNEDNTLAIVFNGEIYNYQTLREQLVASGRHQFKTNSDTEVILHLYEDFGEKTPQLLHGMFTFCIYDLQKECLFLARDRFGEKPLFFTILGQTFAFSSELASLLEYEAVSRKINLDALFYYLHFGRAPTPLTLFAEIEQISPGHWLRWSNNTVHLERYYTTTYQENPDFRDEEAAKEAVRESILQAVNQQMISDVPLGAFLSGGIDSSTIVAAMQRQSSKPVNTFTIRFEHRPYDESAIARQVAEHLGTNHHEFTIPNEGFADDDLWRIIRHVGQPFSDSSAIPTYFISKYVRDHITVCLSGDGGDEMFAGYDYFRWLRAVDRLADRVPQPLLSATDDLIQKMATLPSLHNLGILRKIQRAAYIGKQPANDRLLAMGTIFEQADLDVMATPLFAEVLNNQSHDHLSILVNNSTSASRLRQMMNYRLGFSLSEDMLVKVDRMSMAASLEVRAPMLDVALAELAMQLPDNLLIKGNTTKYILREAVKDWLPASVFNHPKTGFSIPLHQFQNATYRQLCQELILEQTGTIRQLFKQDVVQHLVDRGLNRKHDAADASVYRASHQSWALLQLAAWVQTFQVTI